MKKTCIKIASGCPALAGLKSRTGSKKGFTLLEVLVAVAIGALVLAAVYGTFFMVQKATDTAGGSLDRLYECRKAIDVLRDELASAQAPVNVTGKEYLGKKGSTVSFVTYSPKTGLLTATSYFVREKKGNLSLVKQIVEPGRPAREAVILDRINSFLVEVNTGGGQWTDSGSYSGGQMSAGQEAIRISLSLDFKGSPITLSESVTPMIGRTL
ncbi:MAG: prepilin-type N-terminal cleavage/methylation domain-containing protein [Actinomycetota bacterium]|nr:prepilin-type N-terminal cleavage/methylation domain-containing protein [Actinomycetota bacterium]